MQEMKVQSLGREDPLGRAWQPTPVFLPENSMDRGAWWATVHGVHTVYLQHYERCDSCLFFAIQARVKHGWSDWAQHSRVTLHFDILRSYRTANFLLPPYHPINCEWEFQFLYNPPQRLLVSMPVITGILLGMKRYLIVVSICIPFSLFLACLF